MRSLLYALTVLSLPSRGAWIEIRMEFKVCALLARRSPRGERGLKYDKQFRDHLRNGVAPLAGSVD